MTNPKTRFVTKIAMDEKQPLKYSLTHCLPLTDTGCSHGWLGQAMVLGSFQCRGILLLWYMVGQGPAVLAAGAGWVGCFLFFSSRLSYLLFLMPHLLGDSWTY